MLPKSVPLAALQTRTHSRGAIVVEYCGGVAVKTKVHNVNVVSRVCYTVRNTIITSRVQKLQTYTHFIYGVIRVTWTIASTYVNVRVYLKVKPDLNKSIALTRIKNDDKISKTDLHVNIHRIVLFAAVRSDISFILQDFMWPSHIGKIVRIYSIRVSWIDKWSNSDTLTKRVKALRPPSNSGVTHVRHGIYGGIRNRVMFKLLVLATRILSRTYPIEVNHLNSVELIRVSNYRYTAKAYTCTLDNGPRILLKKRSLGLEKHSFRSSVVESSSAKSNKISFNKFSKKMDPRKSKSNKGTSKNSTKSKGRKGGNSSDTSISGDLESLQLHPTASTSRDYMEDELLHVEEVRVDQVPEDVEIDEFVDISEEEEPPYRPILVQRPQVLNADQVANPVPIPVNNSIMIQRGVPDNLDHGGIAQGGNPNGEHVVIQNDAQNADRGNAEAQAGQQDVGADIQRSIQPIANLKVYIFHHNNGLQVLTIAELNSVYNEIDDLFEEIDKSGLGRHVAFPEATRIDERNGRIVYTCANELTVTWILNSAVPRINQNGLRCAAVRIQSGTLTRLSVKVPLRRDDFRNSAFLRKFANNNVNCQVRNWTVLPRPRIMKDKKSMLVFVVVDEDSRRYIMEGNNAYLKYGTTLVRFEVPNNRENGQDDENNNNDVMRPI